MQAAAMAEGVFEHALLGKDRAGRALFVLFGPLLSSPFSMTFLLFLAVHARQAQAPVPFFLRFFSPLGGGLC